MIEFNLYTLARKGFFSRTYYIHSGDELIYELTNSFFYKKCTFRDITGEEIFVIKRNFAPFQMKFSIEYQDHIYARVTAKGVFNTKLEVVSDEGAYLVVGKSFHREFTIIKNDEEIAKVSRKPGFNSKTGIAIREGEDDEFILALVMLIEIIIKLKRSKSG